MPVPFGRKKYSQFGVLSTRLEKEKRKQSTAATGFYALPGDLAENHANLDFAFGLRRNDPVRGRGSRFGRHNCEGWKWTWHNLPA